MAQNYILLERIELNASAASVTFSSIPQTGYTDLKIVASTRDTNASANNGDIKIYFNGTTGTTNYSYKWLYGTGSAANSLSYTSQSGISVGLTSMDSAGNTANTFGNTEIYIPNYLSSTAKSVSADAAGETNATAAYAGMTAGLWSQTAAISSVTLLPTTAFDTYSTFSLYGIAAVGTTPAIAPKADGGNVIATDGTYWYHAFLSNGTFTPQVGLSADVLVVAGGGSGGARVGAGGGAGGLVYSASQSLASGAGYSCTIGAGGAAAIQSSNTGLVGNSGTNSVFGGITATGGGGGGAYSNIAALTGGSGGGAGGYNTGGFTTGAAGTSGQGNTGGNSANGGAGGGGGAGAVGTAGTNLVGGSGGAGVNTYSAWATATTTGVSGYYAGGGGGSGDSTAGAGGSGGGGAATTGTTTPATSGTVNTGSGGGGVRNSADGNNFYSGAGGSGIIIIRYPVN